MPDALLISPHLDDVVFSCGGIAARLADAGWRVILVTCFTRSVPAPTGFALACQTDKGISPEIDYMALRRAEDAAAARHLGIADTLHLDFPEAPHRGYRDAAALFGDYAAADDVAQALAQALAALPHADLMLAPQGLGRHVDHRRVIDALPARPTLRYRDTPYAIRAPGATPHAAVAMAVAVADREYVVAIGDTLGRKIAAACAYHSQLGFQFGGAAACATALHGFAVSEGGGTPAERIRGVLPPMLEPVLRPPDLVVARRLRA